MASSRIRLMAVTVIVALAGAGLTAFGWPQAESAPATATGDAPAPSDDLGASLMMGLKSTPGCLGIDAAQETMSGKSVIFAWFENKKAALRWYYSDVHQQVMQEFFPGAEEHAQERPMADVPDDIPILAIASITMSDKAEFEESTLPISQIAIELYTPVTGGLHLGGRFAPDGVEVKNLKDYSPE